jgi:hypothetical protein
VGQNSTPMTGQISMPIDMAFTVEKNEWMDRVNLQLQVKGMRAG